MKSKTLLIAGFIIFALGGTIFHQKVTSEQAITVGGIIFIIAGLVNFVINLISRKRDEQVETKKATLQHALASIVSVAAVVLGVVMLLFQDTFVPLVPFTFGLFALVGAIMLFYTLAIGIRPAQLPAWLYAFPVILLILSVVIYSKETPQDDALVMTLTGAAACLYGIGSICASIKLREFTKAALADNNNATAVSDQPAATDKNIKPLSDNDNDQ